MIILGKVFRVLGLVLLALAATSCETIADAAPSAGWHGTVTVCAAPVIPDVSLPPICKVVPSFTMFDTETGCRLWVGATTANTMSVFASFSFKVRIFHQDGSCLKVHLYVEPA